MTTTEHCGMLVMTVAGEIDMSSADTMRSATIDHLNGRPEALVIDLDLVTFFGSAGLSVLIESHRHAQLVGVGFAIVASRRPALRPLQTTAMDTILPIFPTVDQAAAACARPPDDSGR